ncbi:15328_t:CDS:2, partial [Rhizophagus irregularis]
MPNKVTYTVINLTSAIIIGISQLLLRCHYRMYEKACHFSNVKFVKKYLMRLAVYMENLTLALR